jgi:hypothetical protein
MVHWQQRVRYVARRLQYRSYMVDRNQQSLSPWTSVHRRRPVDMPSVRRQHVVLHHQYKQLLSTSVNTLSSILMLNLQVPVVVSAVHPTTSQVTSFQVWIFVHHKKRTNSAQWKYQLCNLEHTCKTTATEWWLQATLEHTRVPHRILFSSYNDDDPCHMVQVVVVVVVLPTYIFYNCNNAWYDSINTTNRGHTHIGGGVGLKQTENCLFTELVVGSTKFLHRETWWIDCDSIQRFGCIELENRITYHENIWPNDDRLRKHHTSIRSVGLLQFGLALLLVVSLL